MAYHKILKIISNLDDKKEVINWEKTGSENVFQASFSNVSIRIGVYNASYYILDILNSEGVEIESISNDALLKEGHHEQANMLEGIFEVAKRKALGVERVLDLLLNEIDEIIPF